MGGGRATKGKAAGREVKWGKEEGRGGEGTDGRAEFGVRDQGREGGRESRAPESRRAELPKRSRRWRSGVETQQGRDRERAR